MDRLQDFQLSPSMKSNDGESSAPKKMKSLTIFEDLLGNPRTGNLHRGANPKAHSDKDSSNPNFRNVAYAVNERKSWLSFGFTRIFDDDTMYQSIKKNLLSSLNSSGLAVQVEAIYRNGYSTSMNRAKFQSFGMYSMAMKEKCDGDANVNFAWYGASKDEIEGILSQGFSLPMNSSGYGHGFHFSAAYQPLESLRSSTVDTDGIRHLLFCRVILGKVEVISRGSAQHNPSSEEFDAGIDNLVHPRKYIIWNAKVNNHVLPEYIVSFRTSSNCSCKN